MYAIRSYYDVQTIAPRQLQNLFSARGVVDEDALIASVAEYDVLKHRHGFHEHEVLVHHADAEANRFGRGVDMHLFAAEVDGARNNFV